LLLDRVNIAALGYVILSDCSCAYLSRYRTHSVSIVLGGASSRELRAFVEDSRSHVNTGGLRRDEGSGVRTSVAILGELFGVVDGEDAVCGVGGCGVVAAACG
jgi:hypothetical protein